MKKNPVHRSGKKFRYTWKDGVRVPVKADRGKMTVRERKEFTKHVDYLERVKAMRPYFGDVFKPESGYDLREIEKWTPQQKARITKYYRVMAPRLSPAKEKVVKRYRRRDHLDRAIMASLQEKLLPGQTAAIFNVEPGESLEIEFKKHAPIVKRGGIVTDEFRFNMTDFLKDPLAEVMRVLEQTDAQVFKIITGANRSHDTFTRSALIGQILSWIRAYDRPEAERDRGSFDAQFYGEWLNGIIAYKGITLRQQRKKDMEHIERMEAWQAERRRQRAREARTEKKWLKAYDRSSKITGRRGRVK